MAEYLGYTKISSPNARYLEYALGSDRCLKIKLYIRMERPTFLVREILMTKEILPNLFYID